MKKLIMAFIFMFLFMFTPSVSALIIANTSTASGAPACATTLYDSTGESVAGDNDIGDLTSFWYIGQTYNEASAHTICSVTFVISYKVGDITDRNYHVVIATLDGSDNFISIVATSDAVVGSNSWSATPVVFTFSSTVESAASTEYGIAVYVDHAVDASNYAELEYASTDTISGARTVWQDDGSFNTNQLSQDILMKVVHQ